MGLGLEGSTSEKRREAAMLQRKVTCRAFVDWCASYLHPGRRLWRLIHCCEAAIITVATRQETSGELLDLSRLIREYGVTSSFSIIQPTKSNEGHKSCRETMHDLVSSCNALSYPHPDSH